MASFKISKQFSMMSCRVMRKELNRRKVTLKLARREPLPMLQRKKDQPGYAFEQVLEYCDSMLKQGGNLEVEAQRKEVGVKFLPKSKLRALSAASIADSENLERHSECHRIKVGMALAAEILRAIEAKFSWTGKVQSP